MPLPLVLGAAVTAVAGIALFVLGASAMRRGARVAVFLFLLLAVASLTLGGIALTLGVGAVAFEPTTDSAVVAVVEVRATGPGAFSAAFRFADGRETSFSLPGDTLVVETGVLEWTPGARLAGLGTSYRLGAVRGRGRSGPFAVPGGAFRLGPEPRLDLAQLRSRLPPLGVLYRVETAEAVLPVTAEPRRASLQIVGGVLGFR